MSSTVVESPASTDSRGILKWLKSVFGDPNVRENVTKRNVAVYAALAVAGTFVTLYRLPVASWNVLWTDDGGIFLEHAYRVGYLQSLNDPYAGYGHLVPRTIASFTAGFVPVEAVPLVTTIIAAAFTSVLALAVYYFSASHLKTPVTRILVWLLIVASPLAGFEILLSTANLQWYMLAVGFWAAFSRRTSRAGLVVACLVLGVAIASSAIALMFVPVVLLRLVLFRARRDAILTAVVMVAAICQVWVITHATRELPGRANAPFDFVAHYLINVVGNAVIGPWPTLGAVSGDWGGIILGLIMAAAFVALVGAALYFRKQRPLAVAAIAVSLGYFVVMMMLTRYAISNTALWLTIGIGTRYFFLAATLIGVAIACIADAGFERGRPRSLVIGAWVLVGVQVLAIVVNYGSPDPRNINLHNENWAAAVEVARQACSDDPAQGVFLRGSLTSNFDWDTIEISCTELEMH